MATSQQMEFEKLDDVIPVSTDEPIEKKVRRRHTLTGKGVTRKPAHTYSKEDCLTLLRQVASEIPFDGREKVVWSSIHEALKTKIPVDELSLRRKFDRLITQFKRDESESKKDSGTDEEYDEKRALLTEITEHMQKKMEEKTANEMNGLTSSSSKESAAAQQKAEGEAIRDAALTTTPTSTRQAGDDQSRVLKRKNKFDLIDIIGKKNEEKCQLKHIEIEIKKQKVGLLQTEKETALQIAKFQHEENMKKLELDDRKLALDEKKFQEQQLEMEMDRVHKRKQFDLDIELRKAELDEKKLLLELLKNK